MNDFLQQANRMPVTLLIALAYITLAFLTDPFDPTPKDLDAYGWLTALQAGNGEGWRLLTSAFLHGGILHLGFNTLALVNLGPALEMTLGSVRFLLLYVVAALGGSIAVCLLYPVYGPVLGGSGALFGFMGSLLALNVRSGRHLLSFLDFDGPRRLVGWIAGNLVISYLVPHVSNTAHIGGLVAGFLVTFLWFEPGHSPSPLLRQWRAAFTAMAAGLLFWCLVPSTRWDHLWRRVPDASGPAIDRLLRAAAMDATGRLEVLDDEVERLLREAENGAYGR